jgi:hypothetical protein
VNGNMIILTSSIPGFIEPICPGNNYCVGYGAPQQCQPATILVSHTLLYMSTTMDPAWFDLRGADPCSSEACLRRVRLNFEEYATVGYSTEGGLYSAIINGDCDLVVDTEELSFDGVKSLYR